MGMGFELLIMAMKVLIIQSGASGHGDSFSVYGSKRTSTMLRCRIVRISKAVFASLATVRARNASPASDDLFQRSRKQFAAALAHEFKDHGCCHGLLNRARDCGEDIIRVRADQSDRTDDDHKNHRQHNGVLSNVLSGFLGPEMTQQPGEHGRGS